MNVIRRILYIFAAAVVATAAAVIYFPDTDFIQYVMPLMQLGAVTTLVLAALSFYHEEDLNLRAKNLLMNGFLVTVLVPSFFAAGAFMHASQTSWSGGEIHWHADFEVLVEQNGELQRLNLADPEVFCEDTRHEASYMCQINDRTGSTEYHEHNDNRIHLEGTFKTREDASLASFFETFGGNLTNEKLVYPTNDGVVEVSEDGNRSLKILVHRGTVDARHWCMIGEEAPKGELCESFDGVKAKTPMDYVISPYTQGPNLDDIFIVYDSRTPHEALEDLRDDSKYRGFGLLKSGEGYSG
ncbi:MAG: hypothetical protein ABEI58_02620 [Candidatus Nanohaloarchaea archaeon]